MLLDQITRYEWKDNKWIYINRNKKLNFASNCTANQRDIFPKYSSNHWMTSCGLALNDKPQQSKMNSKQCLLWLLMHMVKTPKKSMTVSSYILSIYDVCLVDYVCLKTRVEWMEKMSTPNHQNLLKWFSKVLSGKCVYYNCLRFYTVLF